MQPAIKDLLSTLDSGQTGQQVYDLIQRLYPVFRCITGDGNRETLQILREHIPPLTVHEVPTGTQVFDWTVPKEWNVRDAWVKDPKGNKVADFKDCNLSVVGYSTPVRAKLTLGELKPHLFTLPENPDWIPHRTSYFKETWGFCLPHSTLTALEDGEYEICIDSDLKDGHLTYGELFIPGQSEDEVLFSTHICHPSLCNDGLSALAVYTLLAQHLIDADLRYSYRFLFLPVTIGAITWLALNEAKVPKIKHGMIASCLGDGANPTYKKSRQGNAEIDRVVETVLRERGTPYEINEFVPHGYDERQFCSPGFDLPVGLLSRTPPGTYPEYHTSADNFDLIEPEHLGESFGLILTALSVLEHNRTYQNLNPKCEPQLGRRGLYSVFGGRPDAKATELALLWVLNLSDGRHSLLDIAERSGLTFEKTHEAAALLHQHDLLEECL